MGPAGVRSGALLVRDSRDAAYGADQNGLLAVVRYLRLRELRSADGLLQRQWHDSGSLQHAVRRAFGQCLDGVQRRLFTVAVHVTV